MNAARPSFSRFAALDEADAPHLVTRMSKHDLPIDGERYGVFSRLIARPGVAAADLGAVVLRKLLDTCGVKPTALGAIVLSSRIVDVESAAQQIGDEVRAPCAARGVERACSGFPAATEVAARLCRELQQPVALVAAEVISPNINWEAAAGDLSDHRRARGQASKLFADGAAAVLVQPAGQQHDAPHALEILDAWAGDVPDDDQLLQKAAIEGAIDPWGNVRPGTTECVSMPGRRGLLLVRRAPQIMAESLAHSLDRARAAGLLDDETIAHVVPHQANGLILARLRQQLADWTGPPVVWDAIKDAGNTVSASIPLAMAQVQERLPGGALIGLPSVGAGGPGYRPEVLSTGCVLVRAV